MACYLMLLHEDNIQNKFAILNERRIRTIQPYELPGWTNNSSYCSVADVRCADFYERIFTPRIRRRRQRRSFAATAGGEDDRRRRRRPPVAKTTAGGEDDRRRRRRPPAAKTTAGGEDDRRPRRQPPAAKTTVSSAAHLVRRGPALQVRQVEVVHAQHLDAALDAQVVQRVGDLQRDEVVLRSDRTHAAETRRHQSARTTHAATQVSGADGVACHLVFYIRWYDSVPRSTYYDSEATHLGLFDAMYFGLLTTVRQVYFGLDTTLAYNGILITAR